MSDTDGAGGSQMDKPNSKIRKAIFNLTLRLHSEGHTRRDIVYHLREVADTYENYWVEKDSWNKSPSEKDVVLPHDPDDE